MLRYDIVPYDLEKGLNEGVDPLEIGGAGALELENVRHHQHGKWSKRFGLTGYTQPAAVTSGKSLVVCRDRLSVIGSDGTLHSYSSVESSWRRSMEVPVPIAHQRTVGDFPAPVREWDQILVGGYLILVWTVRYVDSQTPGEIWCQVFDSNTSASIIGPSKIRNTSSGQDAIGLRLIACGTLVILAWSESLNQKIKVKTLETSSASNVTSGWSAEADIVTDLMATSSGWTPFDVASSATSSTQFYVAYVQATNYTIKTKVINVPALTSPASATETIGDGTTFDRVTCVSLRHCAEGLWSAVGASDAVNNRVYIARADTTTCMGAYSLASGTFMIAKDGGEVSRIGVERYSSTQAIVGWSAAGVLVVGGSNILSTQAHPSTAHWMVCGTTGSRQGAENVMTCCQVLSRPIIVNSRFYQYIAVSSSTQPMWALVEIGRSDTDATGTYTLHPTRQCIWDPLLANVVSPSNLGGLSVTNIVNAYATTSSRIECVAPSASGSTRTFVMRRLQAHFDEPACLASSASFSRVPLINGGYEWDGQRVHEWGFDHYPEPPTYVVLGSSGGSLATGTYQYMQVFKFMDGAGNIIRSAPSTPISVTITASGQSVFLYPRGIGLTMKQRPIAQDFTAATKSAPKIFIETYRTQESGDLFYLMNTGGLTSEAGLENTILEGAWDTGEPYYKDTLSDADLVALGYGRVYTEGNRNAFYPAWSLRGFVKTSNRVWGIAPDDETVWYSEVEVTGRLAAFHPTQIVKIPDTIVALGTVRDQVFVLTKGNVYRIIGDGLAPNGTGQPPYVTQLNLPGCVAANSVVSTDDGIFYRDSTDAISLIGGKASAYGEAVKTTLADNPYTFDSVYWKEGNEVRVSVGPSSTSTTGVEIVYHKLRDAWTVNKYYDASTAVASRAIVSYAVWEDPSLGDGTNNNLMVLTSSGKVYKVDQTTHLDDGVWVVQKVAFPWIRGASPQQLGRVGKGFITGRYQTRCNVVLDVAVDYADTWDTSLTWKASAMDETFADTTWVGKVQRLVTNVGRTCEGFRLCLRDQQPDIGPMSTGEGFNLLDVSMEVGFEITDKQGQFGRLARTGARR